MTTLSNSFQLAISVLLEAPPEVAAHAIDVLATRSKAPAMHAEKPKGKEMRRKPGGGDSLPRKGSIRGEVHRLLLQRGRLSRRELICAVAEIRCEDPARIEPQVDEALRRDITGRICRVGRGIYAYQKEQRLDAHFNL